MHPAFLKIPLAHRGYHDVEDSRPENSIAALRAAMERGYGVELDVQLSSDGEAMVFHDDELDRLTPEYGPVRNLTSRALSAIALYGGGTIPTLPEFLNVAGNTPLLLEIKDQVDQTQTEALARRVAEHLVDHAGPIACMSFNPHAMAAFQSFAPNVARGLTTHDFSAKHYPDLADHTRRMLTEISMFDTVGASFISHHHLSLDSAPVNDLRQRGVPILCWTIKSPAEEDVARRLADNVTFEGYAAPLPAAEDR